MTGPTGTSDDKRPLRLYAAIVGVYVLLMGWWVFFFSWQGDRLVRRVDAAGVPLAPEQVEALREATDDSMMMFIFEGGFLALLVLGSVGRVMRALRREILLNRQLDHIPFADLGLDLEG